MRPTLILWILSLRTRYPSSLSFLFLSYAVYCGRGGLAGVFCRRIQNCWKWMMSRFGESHFVSWLTPLGVQDLPRTFSSPPLAVSQLVTMFHASSSIFQNVTFHWEEHAHLMGSNHGIHAEFSLVFKAFHDLFQPLLSAPESPNPFPLLPGQHRDYISQQPLQWGAVMWQSSHQWDRSWSNAYTWPINIVHLYVLHSALQYVQSLHVWVISEDARAMRWE